MKKGLAIIILTIISTANLTANDILTLFSKWENASKIDRIHIGNELLEKGTEEGLLMGKYTYGRNQAIESEARIYDMMSCYLYQEPVRRSIVHGPDGTPPLREKQ